MPVLDAGFFEIHAEKKVLKVYLDQGVLAENGKLYELSIDKIYRVFHGHEGSKMSLRSNENGGSIRVDVEVTSHKQLWDSSKLLQSLNPDLKLIPKDRSAPL